MEKEASFTTIGEETSTDSLVAEGVGATATADEAGALAAALDSVGGSAAVDDPTSASDFFSANAGIVGATPSSNTTGVADGDASVFADSTAAAGAGEAIEPDPKLSIFAGAAVTAGGDEPIEEDPNEEEPNEEEPNEELPMAAGDAAAAGGGDADGADDLSTRTSVCSGY